MISRHSQNECPVQKSSPQTIPNYPLVAPLLALPLLDFDPIIIWVITHGRDGTLKGQWPIGSVQVRLNPESFLLHLKQHVSCCPSLLPINREVSKNGAPQTPMNLEPESLALKANPCVEDQAILDIAVQDEEIAMFEEPVLTSVC